MEAGRPLDPSSDVIINVESLITWERGEQQESRKKGQDAKKSECKGSDLPSRAFSKAFLVSLICFLVYL